MRSNRKRLMYLLGFVVPGSLFAAEGNDLYVQTGVGVLSGFNQSSGQFPTIEFDVCFTTPAAAQSTFEREVVFEQYEVVIGSAKRQTVLTGFLLGGAIAELAVVHIDDNDDRRLRIYAFGDGTWVPILDATLRPEVLFVDVANIGGRDRLIAYEPGHLNWFDPESATERALVAVTSNFNPPRRGEIPHVDVTRDVNGDERDDLVVPDVDSFSVFIQMSDGAFADPVKVGPSIEMSSIYGDEGYRYKPWVQGGRVHEMDYNRDGRRDLVFWNADHFEVHHQDERGLFAPVAKTFTTDVLFDSDDPASLAAPQGLRRRRKDHMPTGDMTGRVLHSLTDMNGDGVADLVVFSLEIRSMWSAHSTYEVYFGTPTPDGGTVFAPDVGTAIQSDGVPRGMGQHDFDHDGQVDMMFTTIKVGFFKTIRMIAGAVLTRSVSLDLDFYRMEGGIYPDKPNATRKDQDGLSRQVRGKSRALAVRADRGCEWRQPLGPAGGEEPERTARLCRRAGAGPVRPAASEGGGRHAQRGIHLAGGPQRGRQAGHPHASPVHHRAASSDDADRPMSKGELH